MRRTTLSLLVATAVVGLVACDPSSTTPPPPPAPPATAAAPPAEQQPPAVPTLPAAPTLPAVPPAPGGADATGDVEITSCEVDSTLHWPSAGVRITNKSSKKSNYMISVEFLDSSGTRVGEGLAATNNLAPGQAATQKAQGAGDVKGKITCKVSNVTRYAAP